MDVVVGTSGWQYRDWRGVLYPEGEPQSNWLTVYAQQFPSVEINNTFYRLPDARSVNRWLYSVPRGFCFAVKMSRYVTHILRLEDCEKSIPRFLRRMHHLRSHLGPVLMQLPPNLEYAPERLSAALECFPADQKVAVEFRHPSWFRDDIAELLHHHQAALALTDRKGWVQEPIWRTADWGYIRLHEGRGENGHYGDDSLETWAERVQDIYGDSRGSVYVYFNNDARGHAVRDAIRFTKLLQEVPLTGHREPSSTEESLVRARRER